MILGFAAIGIVSLFAATWDAIHFHYLMAARDFTGYLVAVVALSIVPKLLDRWSEFLGKVLGG